MSDYTPFAEIAALLPAQSAAVGTALDPFRVIEDAAPFIEPVMTTFEVADDPQVTFVSCARCDGEVGDGG